MKIKNQICKKDNYFLKHENPSHSKDFFFRQEIANWIPMENAKMHLYQHSKYLEKGEIFYKNLIVKFLKFSAFDVVSVNIKLSL